MKKGLLIAVIALGAMFASCGEKTAKEKLEDKAEEAGDGLKKIGKDIGEAAE